MNLPYSLCGRVVNTLPISILNLFVSIVLSVVVTVDNEHASERRERSVSRCTLRQSTRRNFLNVEA